MLRKLIIATTLVFGAAGAAHAAATCSVNLEGNDAMRYNVANIDVPAAGARVDRRFRVGGWAVKDVVGVAKVEVLLDDRVVAVASDAGANEWLRGFLKDASRDPRMPRVQFTAEVDAGAVPAGRHWLGLRVTGGDGSVETWAEQPVEIR